MKFNVYIINESSLIMGIPVKFRVNQPGPPARAACPRLDSGLRHSDSLAGS